MSDGKNILELVLNQNIAKKFNEIDDGVVKIQKDMDLATDSAGRFLAKMQELSQIFNVSGAGDFAANIDKLVQSMNSLNAAGSNTSGLVKQNEATQQIGQSAVQSVDDVNRLIDAINKLPEALNKSKQGAGGGGEKKSILDSLLFDTSSLEQKRREFSELIKGLELQLSSASQRMRSGSDMNVANSSIYRFYDELANRCRERIENITKGISLNGVMDSWQQQGIFDKIEQGQTTYQKELQKAIADEETLSKIILDIEKEYETLTQKAESYRKAADLGKGMEEQSRTEYTAILQQLAEVRAKYQAVSDEIKKVIDTNKKMEQSSKELEGYKKRLEEMAVAWERMKLTGTAYDKNGRMTAEAQQLMEDKKALEEKIRLYQMSADEAIKQEQRKKAEIERSEKDTASEIKRLLDERLRLLHQIREAETKRDTTQSGTELYRLLNVQIEEYKKKLAEVTEATKNVAKGNESIAAEAAKAYSTKRAEQRVKEEEKYQNAIDKTINELKRLKEERDKANQKQARESIGLEGGQAPKTIEQYRIAIQNLKREIGKLDTETQKSKINEYNQRIQQYQTEINKATDATQKFRNENVRLNGVLQQVAGAFGVYLSIQSLVGFAKNVREVTGEFELQHRAMQAIIGDMDKANRLWDKTVRLAVKSPYSVKELVTYTKQLAAYRIETEKLYDTTKMLADISSGLGVDMQRLILAYGQVKAANYLRGQELRQFSEAGVNILGELAEYFSELRGEMVSTGEVFDMVSKRMVKFEDVSEVLKRLTQEGGIFYNMQEIQSETLKGMFMNLKDSFDLMKNEIGESNKGLFVTLVNSAKYLADNWKSVANVLRVVTGLVIAFKIAQTASAVQMLKTGVAANIEALALGRISRSLVSVIAGMNGARAATIGFSTAIKNIPVIGWILAILSAVISIISAINAKIKESNELQNKLTSVQIESNAESNKMIYQYKSLTEKIKDANTKESERYELLNKLKKIYSDILPQRMLEIDYIMSEKNAYEKATEAIRTYYQEKRREREIETIENDLGQVLDKEQKGAAKSIQKMIEQEHGLKVSIADVNIALEEFKKGVTEGTIPRDGWLNELVNLLKIQTGIADLRTADFMKIFNYSFSRKSALDNVNSFVLALRNYNEEMELATSQTGRFGGSTKKILEDALSVADDEFEQSVLRIKQNTNLTLDELHDEIKKEAVRIYGAFWDEFKKKPEYLKNRGYFDNLYEIMIKARIDENSLSKAQENIAKKISDFAKELSISNITQFEGYLYDGKKSLTEYYNFIKTESENATLKLRQVQSGIVIISDDEKKKLEETEPLLAKLFEWLKSIFDPKKTGNGGNKALQLLNKQIEAIKNAKKQYEEYKKLYDDVTAFDRTKAAVQELFRELNIEKVLDSNNFEGNSIETQIESWLSSQINAAGKDGRIAIQKYVRELSLAAEQADFSVLVKGFKEGAEKAFSDYDMYKELQKLGIGGDISETVFGVSTKSLKQLEAELERLRDSLYAQYDGTEAVKAYEEMLDKLKELDAKEQVEKLKKYTEYLTKGRDEAVKIHLEELTKIQELDELYSEGKFNETQYSEILRRIKEETQQALDKNAWEDFKGSDFYSAMFEDMAHMADSSIDLMYNKLQNLRNRLSSLDPTQVKEIVSQMDKLDEERRNRHPFRYLIQDIRTLMDLDKKGNENLLAQFVGDEAELERQKAILAKEVAELNAEYNRLSIDEIEGNETDVKTNLDDKERQLADLEKQLIKIKKRIGEINNENQKGQSAYQNINATLQKSVEHFNDLASAAGTIASGIVDAIGGVDEATKDLVNDIASLVENAGLLVSDIGKAIASGGTDIASMIDGLLRMWYIIENSLKIGDYTYNKEIEEQTDALEKLEWQYDRLKIARDKAWSVTDLKSKNDAIVENINSQIQAYDRMINAEEQKKYKDEEVIEQYKKERTELYDDLEEQLNSFRESMGGISTEDYGSAAQEFVDAWAEAFMETGDGLEALQETFDEYLKNLVKKQALERVAKHYLEDIFDMINDAIGDDGLVSIADMDKIREKFDSIAPQFSSAMQAIFESLGIFGDQASGELTGLQKGIQGVTEDTAEIIAAYLNAMRLIVIENGSKLSQIINIIQDTSGLYNPMLVELRNIKNRADDIYYFLNQRRENGTDSLRVYVVNA
jgi:DNA repair exonuclease SbcCD ATPase subunit